MTFRIIGYFTCFALGIAAWWNISELIPGATSIGIRWFGYGFGTAVALALLDDNTYPPGGKVE